MNAEKIVESMEFLNLHHEVLNEGRFGRLQERDSDVEAVIVIQVRVEGRRGKN